MPHSFEGKIKELLEENEIDIIVLAGFMSILSESFTSSYPEKIIKQKAGYIEDGDTPEILQKRVMEQAEWIILPEAVEEVSKNFKGE